MMNNLDFNKKQRELLDNYSKMSTSVMFKLIDIFTLLSNIFSKNKKIIYIVILSLILIRVIVYFTTKEPKGLFQITTNTGVIYNTDGIEIKDGCVYFKRTSNDNEIIICGGVIIEKTK
jgi:hypothetical protein